MSHAALLRRLFEHNQWATSELLAACMQLEATMLDARPASEAPWSIRENLTHLIEAEYGYLRLLGTVPERPSLETPFDELLGLAETCARGAAVLAEDCGERSRFAAEIESSTDTESTRGWWSCRW